VLRLRADTVTTLTHERGDARCQLEDRPASLVDAEERVEEARSVEERAQLRLYAALDNMSRYTESGSEPAVSQRSSHQRSRGEWQGSWQPTTLRKAKTRNASA